ncbi:MAG: glycosyltransferase [Chloroflexi bacterium]|nr:glycosyltransferase [Chloroflexota bacterium]
MRIAYLTQPYPPMVSGAAIVAEHLAREMAQCGHEVLVIAASDTGHQYVERRKNLTVLRMKSIRNPLRVNQRLMFFQRHAVLKALYDFQPDVIHVHEPVQMGLVGLKYVRHTRIPITMTTHQLPWFVASYLPNIPFLRGFVERLLWTYSRWLVKNYTAVISPTKTITSIIKTKIGIKAKTINYGIDLQTFKPNPVKNGSASLRAKFQIPDDAPIILHAGRLDTDKRMECVILAAASIIKTSGAILLIAGDGCEKTALIKLCRSLGIEANVRFTGFIANKEELAVIYRMSDVFVTASEIETQGIAILEAAASGLPIVAVKATCIPEIVQHGGNGYLTSPGDIQAMGKAISRILSDPTKAREMKIKSRIIAEKFKAEVTFSKHEKLYKQMIRQKSRQTFISGKPAKNPLFV